MNTLTVVCDRCGRIKRATRYDLFAAWWAKIDDRWRCPHCAGGAPAA